MERNHEEAEAEKKRNRRDAESLRAKLYHEEKRDNHEVTML
ncbi:hypothetical protein ACFL4T_13230 [candidate division KSB1 bacterium]